MKRITFIFAILLSLIAMTSCENANVTKLKKQVASLNALCPINAGVGGDFLSIKYNENDKMSICISPVMSSLVANFSLKKIEKMCSPI